MEDSSPALSWNGFWALQELAAGSSHLAGSLSFLGLLRIPVAGGRLEWLLLRESRQAGRGGRSGRKEESNGKRVIIFIFPLLIKPDMAYDKV